MQGFNMGRYYPPDASNAPTFNASSHPLGKRANKISQGILTVRFELPFAVWCDHCTPPAIVGQGVRFNAEKKKVGKYHSTPIWSFRMKHSACGGWWEIRTDPKNAEYLVVEGAKKRDYGPEHKGAEAEGDLKFLTEEEKERRRNDAFANLEGKMEDKGNESKNKERVEELYDKSEVWRDPYDVNARLRKGFREKRKVWKKDERHKQGMQDRFGLDIEIVDETEADCRRASLIEFGSTASNDQSEEGVAWKSLFNDMSVARSVEPVPNSRKQKSEIKAEKSRQTLQQTLIDNTKAAVDPFLVNSNNLKVKPAFGILKRKRHGTQTEARTGTSTINAIPLSEGDPTTAVSAKPALPAALVEYDSD
jgi:coiled-coil domain-containing protein 130